MIPVETETRSKNHSTLRIPSREEFHRHYGGKLYESDFCTYYSVSLETIAGKIMVDLYEERKDIKKARERQNK